MQPDQQQSKKARLKELWDEGWRRHVRMVKGEKQVVNLPLNIVILGTLLAPWLVGIGVLIGLMTGHSVSMTKDDGREPAPPTPPAAPTEQVDPLMRQDDI